jgi:signal transduction histidine kinase/CheY-like chemotaxis protein
MPSTAPDGETVAAAAVPPPLPHDRLQRRIGIAAAVFALALVAVQAVQVWHEYAATRAGAERRAATLVYILSAHMRESVAALDAALVQIAAASGRLGGPEGDQAAWSTVLTGAYAGMTSAGSLSVVDKEGIIRQSTVAQIIGQSRRDLYVFQTLSSQPGVGLVADTPFQSLTSGEMLIPLGRRLDSPDGNFQGAVVATMRLQQLRDFYRSVDVGSGGMIRVFHADGLVLFREPSTEDPIGEPALDDPVYQAYRAGNGGQAAGVLDETGPDGRALVTAFQSLPSPGMLLAVSLDRDTALAGWYRDLEVGGGLLAAELLALLILTVIIQRLVRARRGAMLDLASRDRQMQLAQSIAHMGAATFDTRAGTVQLSPQIAAILGWPQPRERMPVEELLASVGDADRPQVADAIRACAAGGGAYRREFHITRPDGAERIIWSEGFRDTAVAGGAVVVAIWQDVTERRLAERQLIQAQKMEGVGQLTGGVAHDFNNLLTVVIGNLEGLAERHEADAGSRAMAELALKAADRGAELVRGLLAFSRKQPLQPRAVDLNAIVRETDQLLRRTLGEQIDLETRLEREPWPTLVDPAQLQASLINLAVNARDSMPGGGKLTIETGNVVLDEHYVLQNPDAAAGAYVLLAVSDTGSGIRAALLDRVFEPFFTTKEAGRGTGLGLSMVYGFIKQSNGHIKIYSEEGHGTTVRMYLPRSADDAAADRPASAAEPALAGSECVLVVEDDAMVRDFVMQQLQALGYRTPVAGTGPEALGLLERTPEIALLLTDVILPGELTGKQLADEAQRRRPDLRVLYMSGYTENAIVHHGRLDPGVLLLSKPFRSADLARMVRKALS